MANDRLKALFAKTPKRAVAIFDAEEVEEQLLCVANGERYQRPTKDEAIARVFEIVTNIGDGFRVDARRGR